MTPSRLALRVLRFVFDRVAEILDVLTDTFDGCTPALKTENAATPSNAKYDPELMSFTTVSQF